MKSKQRGSMGKRSLATVLMIPLGAWVVLACGPAAAQEASEEAPAASATDVEAIWAKNCKSCHGEDGKGETKAGKMQKAPDFTNAEIRAGFDRARMIVSVTEGVKDESGKMRMRGYGEKLSAAEIAALVDYIYALPH